MEEQALPESVASVSEESDAAALWKVSGWTGSAVDSVCVRTRGGSIQSHGGLGGWAQKEYILEPHEVVVAVAQESRVVLPEFLGNAIVFYTSLCQVLAFEGEDARRRNRFVAPVGSQVVGLQFVGSQITGVHLERMETGDA